RDALQCVSTDMQILKFLCNKLSTNARIILGRCQQLLASTRAIFKFLCNKLGATRALRRERAGLQEPSSKALELGSCKPFNIYIPLQ
ncbi:MAG: hypothetical protein ABIC82_02645, partial [bacterium]